jgi:MinD-like ATPase involved in chromosome partitioning or flagellar assembly
MIIAIWGRDGVGKSMLCDTLGLLLSQKDVAAVIDTDLTQPTLPIRVNGLRLDADASLGKAVSGIGTGNASSFLHQHSQHKGLFYAGLVDGDDYMSYEAGLDADETAQDFVEQCSELADTVILDLSGQRTDPFLPGALLHADRVIVLFTPDVQGICWYQSVAPLFRNRQAQGHVLLVAAMIGKHHDIPAVEKATGASFAAVLPFVKEFRQTNDSGMSPLEGVTSSATRYQRQVRQLNEQLMEVSE